MGVGLVTIPVLIKHLGTDRFAVITIVWMLIGYFSLFDMGLGRALTQLIAGKIGKDRYEDVAGIFWTSMSLILACSAAGALLFAMIASPLVHSILKVPLAFQHETESALYVTALSIPFVTLTSALIGVLTAYHRFDIINAIRIPMGTYSYAAPLAIIPFSNNLIPIIAALLIGRIITFGIHLHYCFKIAPDLRKRVVLETSIIKPLFRFGGWMTVSNILGPFMVYFDRFLIGAVISITAVAYYATPYEIITKLWMIPGALMNVLFPAFAANHAENPSHTAELFHRAVKYQLLGIFPLVFVIVAGAHQGIALWLGHTFADNSFRVLQWLAIGVFINCLAQVPFSFLQGVGKPDITSKLHIAELLLYIPALWFLVKAAGINGAALAWTGRVAVDSVLLFYATRRSFTSRSGVSLTTGICAIAAIACLVGIVVLPQWDVSFAIFAVMLIALMTAGWKLLLSVNERSYLVGKLSALKSAK
ncbi:flippase [Geobacter hydrogenophilus]|uniref:O-antigen transporter n=2 Tax=Geobacter hydrogenophilus TaxID=40983 RepID=A0A9W6G2X6_9BACT|nr:flippase [Geobacter hydrogenophilus]GLI39399.1 putative O-antigen transporter [Geobacter hydrogenophilus]